MRRGKGSNRNVNIPPNVHIENDDDMLFTNQFVSTINTRDVNDTEKKEFRRYYESRNKIATETPRRELRTAIVDKKQKDILKTEKVSIVDLDTSNRNTNLYPAQNHFKMELGKTFYNVKRVKLVSTSIPNTDQVITDTPIEIRNNTISWQNLEDIDLGIYRNCSIETTEPDTVDITISGHRFSDQQREGDFLIRISKSTSSPNIDGQWLAEIIDENTIRINFYGGIAITADATIDAGFPNYTISITPGNYSITTISSEIQSKLNSVKRRNNTGVIFHYFTVDVSLDTDVVTFRSYITKQLQNNPISTTAGTGIITVHSVSHGFKRNDYVLMINLKNTGGLTSTILNGLYQVNVVDVDTFTYEVNERASNAADGGGATCKTGKPSEFRLLFDTSRSIIVFNIGFRDEDSGSFMNLNESAPLTTETKTITGVNLTGNYLDFTSPSHGLTDNTIFTVSQIVLDILNVRKPMVVVSTAHRLQGVQNVFIYYPFSEPKLNNFYEVIVNGSNTFLLSNVQITSSGSGSGLMKMGGDKVKLLNFNCIPSVENKVFCIENTTANTFRVHIPEGVISYQNISLEDVVVCTNKLYVKHQEHGFNTITAIDPYTSTSALITTSVRHLLSGTLYENIQATTAITNTVDLVIINHGIETSDNIYVSHSNTVPNIDGNYFVQVVDTDTVRISVIGGVTTAGTCSVNKGQYVVISGTNSVPDVSTNVFGDSKYYVNVIDPYSFTIDTGFNLTVNGTSGLIGRELKISTHGVMASSPGGDSFAGIPLTSVNGKYHKIDRIINENEYLITLIDFATKTYSGGGNQITVSSERHGFRNFQSNTYTGEETGKLYRSISLEGENFIFLISNNLQTVYSPGNEKIGDIFAKILLNEPPGLMMFDSFISAPKDFSPPLAVFKDIEIYMKRRDGYLFNFNNINYSISLEITEIIDQISNTGISGRTGSSDIY